VRQLFHSKIRAMYVAPQFVADVMKPLNMDDLMDQEVLNLSGGELQRVAIVLALGMPADIYLIDEPSAYLDSEQRIIAAKVIKRFILHSQKTAFIVEHDFIMATYLADRVIVYSGTPAKDAVAHAPQDLLSGMNTFLKDLQITFRRDPTNHRPRINKMFSVKDKEQKAAGTYFYLGDDDEETMVGPDGKKLTKDEIRKKDKEKKVGHCSPAAATHITTTITTTPELTRNRLCPCCLPCSVVSCRTPRRPAASRVRLLRLSTRRKRPLRHRRRRSRRRAKPIRKIRRRPPTKWI
jgi:ABC-type proline/glycine betaine transport system ATPase subunit